MITSINQLQRKLSNHNTHFLESTPPHILWHQLHIATKVEYFEFRWIHACHFQPKVSFKQVALTSMWISNLYISWTLWCFSIKRVRSLYIMQPNFMSMILCFASKLELNYFIWPWSNLSLPTMYIWALLVLPKEFNSRINRINLDEK